jgi:thioredoxin reductase (NADPH)
MNDEAGTAAILLVHRDAQPAQLETSVPGVFAVGDVRAGSSKRVAAAVREGSTAVRLVHDHLARSEGRS